MTGHPLTLQPPDTTCGCVTTHAPTNIQYERHHIWPQEFGGPSVPENLIYICSNTHNNIHAYLRAFAARKALLTTTQLRADLPQWHYAPSVQGYAYQLACTGWDRIQRQAL